MVSAREDELPDYAEVAEALRRCAVSHCAAEAHGFALGLLAAGVGQPRQVWQQELYSDLDPADVLAGECRAVLDRVFASVFSTPDDQERQLVLLLPQDLVVDTARLTALRDWCQGFLYGFGLGGDAVTQRLSAQGRELLADIAEFTRLDTDAAAAADTAANQSALIEIEEYLRVGVMLIRDDLGGRPGKA